MLKRFTLGIILLFFGIFCCAAHGKPAQKNKRNTVEDLTEDVLLLRNEVANLSAEVRNLRGEIDLLKLNNDELSDRQQIKVRKITEDIFIDYEKKDITDQKINGLSAAFTDSLTSLAENFRSVINRVISTLNAQQKLSNILDGMSTKNSDGIAYEVKAGETLDGIAKKFNTTKDALKNINFIIDESKLPAGQMLFVQQSK